MIKLTWGNLRDKMFMEPLERIFQTRGIGWEIKSKLMVLGETLKSETKRMDVSYKELLDQYCSAEETGSGMRKIKEETKVEFEKALEKFSAQSFECKINKFDPLKVNEKVELSAADLMALNPIFHPFELPGETTPLKAVPSTPPAEAPAPATH